MINESKTLRRKPAVHTPMKRSLQDLFAQAGTVDTVNVVRDRETGRARGFAFVEMGTRRRSAGGDQPVEQLRAGRPRVDGERSASQDRGWLRWRRRLWCGRRRRPAPLRAALVIRRHSRAGNVRISGPRFRRRARAIRFSASMRRRTAALAIASSPERCTCGSRRSIAAISSLSCARVALSVEVGVLIAATTCPIPPTTVTGSTRRRISGNASNCWTVGRLAAELVSREPHFGQVGGWLAGTAAALSTP